MRPSRRHHRIPKQQQRHQESEQEEDDDDEYSVNQQSHSSSLQRREQQSNTDNTTNIDDDDDNDNDNDNDDIDDDNYSSSSDSSSSSLLPSTYVSVAPLPVFRGSPSECPLAHLSRFRRVCRANNASSPSSLLRIFPVTLDAEAALWYDLTVAHRTLPWPRLRSAFLAAFLHPAAADRARADLMALKQGEAESAAMFHLRMQWILKKWPGRRHGLPDSLLKGIFVDGLREDFQDWIVPQGPETLGEAVRLAERWEQVRSMRDARRMVVKGDVMVVINCGFCDGGGHEERECEVRRKMRELWLRSRNANMGGDVGAGESGDGRNLGRMVSLGRKGQQQQGQNCCQCLKHQCWKNKFERSASVAGEKNAAAAAAADQS